MSESMNGQGLINGGNMIPIKIGSSHSKVQSFKLNQEPRHDKKGVGINNVFGNSSHTVSYALGMGDPRYRRTAGATTEQVPSLAALQKQYPSLTQAKYEEILGGQRTVDSHKNTFLETKGYQGIEKIKNGLDLGEQERINRFKYGVKKPANKWYHEMDDSRLTGDQIRTTNFRGDMFTADKIH